MFIRVQDKLININDISHIELNINDEKTIFIRTMHGNASLSFHYKTAAEAKRTLDWLTDVLIDEQ